MQKLSFFHGGGTFDKWQTKEGRSRRFPKNVAQKKIRFFIKRTTAQLGVVVTFTSSPLNVNCMFRGGGRG